MNICWTVAAQPNDHDIVSVACPLYTAKLRRTYVKGFVECCAELQFMRIQTAFSHVQ